MKTLEERVQDMGSVLQSHAGQAVSAANYSTTDFRETMRALALGSGAVATGALVLISLSDKIPVIQPLIALGVATLLIEFGLSFYYLFTEQVIKTDHLIENARKGVKAPAEAMLLAQDCEDGKITREQLDKQLTIKEKEIAEFVRERNTKLADGSFINDRRGNWKTVCITVLFIGIGFIVLGIVLPYFCK